jgi:hypothetical protein
MSILTKRKQRSPDNGQDIIKILTDFEKEICKGLKDNIDSKINALTEKLQMALNLLETGYTIQFNIVEDPKTGKKSRSYKSSYNVDEMCKVVKIIIADLAKKVLAQPAYKKIVQNLQGTKEEMVLYYTTACVFDEKISEYDREESFQLVKQYLTQKGFFITETQQGIDPVSKAKKEIQREEICQMMKNYLGISIVKSKKLSPEQVQDILSINILPSDILIEILLYSRLMMDHIEKKYFPLRYANSYFDRNSRSILERNDKVNKLKLSIINMRLVKVIEDYIMIFEKMLTLPLLGSASMRKYSLSIKTVTPDSELKNILELIITYEKGSDEKISQLISDSIARETDTEENRINPNNSNLYFKLKPIIRSNLETRYGTTMEYICNYKNKTKIVEFIIRMLLMENESINKINVKELSEDINLWNEIINSNYDLKINPEKNTYSLKRDITVIVIISSMQPLSYEIVETNYNRNIADNTNHILCKYPTRSNNIFADEWFLLDTNYWRDVRLSDEIVNKVLTDQNYYDYNETDSIQNMDLLKKNIEDFKSNISVGPSGTSYEITRKVEIDKLDNMTKKIVACNFGIKIRGFRDDDMKLSRYTHIWGIYDLLFRNFGFSFHLFNRICRIDENARLKYSL